MSDRVIAVITARNEADTIGDLVRALLAQRVAEEVIVVDAGSSDKTGHVASTAGAVVLWSLAPAPTIAGCLRHGWRQALDLFGADRILQIDAGGSHDPAEAIRLLVCDADLVIGSRFCPAGRYVGRPWRAALSRAAAVALNSAQLGARHTDWTSGYRVFARRAAQYLLGVPYVCTMHGWQIEVLARAGEAGLRIAEAPITYTAGRSSFSPRIVGEAAQAYLHVLHHIGWVGSKLREEGLS